MNRILVATDGSPSSATAVQFAAELAAAHGSDLHIVHVVPTVDVVTIYGIESPGSAWPHNPTEHDHVILAEAAALAAQHGVVATTALLGGSPVTAILASADSQNVDLTIVGTRGHGAVASALLGSVSLGVLQHATRRVVIVRGEERPGRVSEPGAGHVQERFETGMSR